MAQPQARASGKSQTKKQVTELPDAVKRAVGSKITAIEGEIASIGRRSELKEKLQSLATWLKSEEPLSSILKGKSQNDDDDPKKNTQNILKKAADNLLKNIGVRPKEEAEKAASPGGAPTSGEEEGASEGDGSQ
jgi:hypothetical protein